MSDRREADGSARDGSPELGGASVRGYELMMPPGWVRLDTGSGAERRVAELVRKAFSGRSRDEAAAARREMEQALKAMVSDAREQGVLDLFFPFSTAYEALVPASFAVSAMDVDEGEDPMDVLVGMASADRTARAVDVAGSVAIRTEARFEAEGPVRSLSREMNLVDDAVDALAETEGLVTQQVRYLVGVPGSSTQWVSVIFTATVPDGEAGVTVGDALVELFDAIMTSFRWR